MTSPLRGFGLGFATSGLLALMISTVPVLAQPVNDQCALAEPLVFGQTDGTTVGASGDGTSLCDSEPGGPDVWYSVTLANPGVVFVDAGGVGLSLSLRAGCGEPEIVCSQAVPLVGQKAQLQLDFDGGETYVVRVATQEGPSSLPAPSPFTLRVGTGASISGKITEAQGVPLGGINLLLVSHLSASRTTQTDQNGEYHFADLAATRHVLYAGHESAYVAEIWDDVPCALLRDCPPPTVLETTLGEDLTGIDFELDLGAAITGRVTDIETGLPIELAPIALTPFAPYADVLHWASTDEHGVYRFEGLEAGTYSLRSDQLSAYRGQMWDHVACSPFGCEPSTGTPLELVRGQLAEHVDFGLDHGGIISGRVVHRGDGSPVSYETVHLLDLAGGFRALARTDGDGVYALTQVNPGSYLVRTAAERRINELFDDVPCGLGGDCEVAAATPVIVSVGFPATDINFELAPGGIIRGTVRDASTHAVLPDGRVELYGHSGELVTVVFATINGQYEIGGLAEGTFFAVAYDDDDEYTRELYDDIPCLDGDCVVTSGTPIVVASGEVTTVNFELELAPLRCDDDEFTLCLNNRRFAVRTSWRTPQGWEGFGHAVALAGREDSGYFWFFDSNNVELVVKALDACVDPFNRFWVFAAGLTNVEVTMTVTDIASGRTHQYFNPLGRRFQPLLDTRTFDTCPAGNPAGATTPSVPGVIFDELGDHLEARVMPPAARNSGENGIPPCADSPTAVCLGERFLVEATWTTADGGSAPAKAVPLLLDTGLFWFFDSPNIELVVKVLSDCGGLSNRFWVFAGGLTNVAVDLVVTDTQTGAENTYHNPQGWAFLPIQDTQAFDTCDGLP